MASISFLIVSADKEEKYLFVIKNSSNERNRTVSLQQVGTRLTLQEGRGYGGRVKSPLPYQIFSLYKRRN